MQRGGARYPDPEPAFLRAPYRQGSLDDRMTTAGCSRNFVSDHFSCSIWSTTPGHDSRASGQRQLKL
jgi:hypothetical protein